MKTAIRVLMVLSITGFIVTAVESVPVLWPLDKMNAIITAVVFANTVIKCMEVGFKGGWR